METLWFVIIALMLATYVVRDGFDFGAGILHLFVAKSDTERRTVLAAIGPLWDGNEVWLVASGGVLVYAFPRAYSAGFSGFYMPLMMVLWLLILRGISIEFRSHQPNPLWRSFWDGVFAFSSTLMAIFLGAALGNVIRGVPVDETGFFSGPLFTDFTPGIHPGVLDWYTVLVGLFTLAILAGHGSLFLAWKTAGDIHQRSLAIAARVWVAIAILMAFTTVATATIRPNLYGTLADRPWVWLLVLLALGCLVSVFVLVRRVRELPAFLASAGYIVSMLGATAALIYPNILVSTLGAANNLTIYNAASGGLAMKIGLYWWIPALLLAVGYFVFLFHQFRGKVSVEGEGHGY
jgi:cytochrome d ubiquinol oxidase subunit II